MAKFKFRLATLQQIRESARDQRRAELAQAYHADELLEQQQEELRRESGELAQKMRQSAGKGQVDIEQLLSTQRYEVVLRWQEQQLRQQREAVAEEIERRREALVHANRQVRVLEKLHDRQLERHREEEARQHAKQLDEVAGQRALRKEDDQ